MERVILKFEDCHLVIADLDALWVGARIEFPAARIATIDENEIKGAARDALGTVRDDVGGLTGGSAGIPRPSPNRPVRRGNAAGKPNRQNAPQ